MNKFLRSVLVAAGAISVGGGVIALADYAATQGSGTTFGSIVVSAKHYMQMLACDPAAPSQCVAVSAGGAAKVDGSAATQPVSGTVTANAGTNLNTSALATSAKQPALGTAGSASADVLTVQGIASMTPLLATLSAETTKVIGTVRNLGNAGAIFDGATGAAVPANVLYMGANNGGNLVGLPGDGTNGLWVNIKAGAGSGGTAIADKAAWTVSSTNFTLAGGEFTTGGATACTTGQACTVGMTAARGFFTDVSSVNGVTVLTGTGAVGTGAQRVAVGTDTATIAGSAPGTAGSASTNVVSVQGIASMTPLLVNPGTAANWGVVAQASTTSGQVGVLNQCAVTTGAPTYTTAQTDPISCDTAGNIRVNVMTATGLAQGSTTSGQTGSMVMAAVTAANPTYTTAQTAYSSQDVKGNTRVVLGGGVPETASATGTTAATTATLATAAATTTYICGFSIRANATAAATGNATVTGTITGTMNFTQWTAPLASGVGVTEEIFSPCIPASAVNTSIAVVSAAPGSGGVVSVSAWGYQQ